jgi:hypothetical protein
MCNAKETPETLLQRFLRGAESKVFMLMMPVLVHFSGAKSREMGISTSTDSDHH